MIQKTPVLHINLWAHIQKMVYCTSLHFFKAWTMVYRWNIFWKASRCLDKASTRTPRQTDTLKVWAGQWPWPRSSYGSRVMPKRTKLMVSRSCYFQLFASTVSTSYSRFFFTNSSNFRFYILLLLFSFLRKVWMLFKEYGCSKTERIQKWPGGLSNALLRVHYKDE